MLVISADGCESFHPWPPERIQPKLCLFEFVYLARPDSRLYGQELHGARVRMGELLAEQAPVSADMVVGVPDSGVPAAEGYSPQERHPFWSRPGEKPLYRADVHQPGPGPARPRCAAQIEPAA